MNLMAYCIFYFVKGRFIMSCSYDLKNDSDVCCSKSVKYQSSSLFDVINSVYKAMFCNVLYSECITCTLSGIKE
jgi:hypothetical protein